LKSSDLQEKSFATYPPQARALAIEYLGVLKRMPLALLALVLRQLIQYDWSFPAEREQLELQLKLLSRMDDASFSGAMAAFIRIPLTNKLLSFDWVERPQPFSEQLTAYLWEQHLSDDYHSAAGNYQMLLQKAIPQTPPVIPRWTIVVIGRASQTSEYPLFRRLAPHGTLFTQLNPSGTLDTLYTAVKDRARQHPQDYGHWYIDGGEPLEGIAHQPGLTLMSYPMVVPAAKREFALLKRLTSGTGAKGSLTSEAVGSYIAGLRPEDLNLEENSSEAPLRHFEVNLITQGAGCQIFSTTFVQWASRECLHRAQPLTLFARFATRQRNAPMEQLLDRDPLQQPQDAEGSLIDADMGAYYTWINQSRLPGADQSRFLVWFEDQHLACAISPTLPEGTTSSRPIDIRQVLQQMA
jgi:hypothetical protein